MRRSIRKRLAGAGWSDTGAEGRVSGRGFRIYVLDVAQMEGAYLVVGSGPGVQVRWIEFLRVDGVGGGSACARCLGDGVVEGVGEAAQGGRIQMLGVAGEDLFGRRETGHRHVTGGREENFGQVGEVACFRRRSGGPWCGQERMTVGGRSSRIAPSCSSSMGAYPASRGVASTVTPGSGLVSTVGLAPAGSAGSAGRWRRFRRSGRCPCCAGGWPGW